MKLTDQDKRDLTAAFIVAGVSVGAIALLAAYGCTPAQREAGIAGAEASCRLVEAFGGTPEQVAICATAAELAKIADAVTAARGDGGPPDGGARHLARCRPIPTTAVCATDGELAPAIRAELAQRDGGSR